MTADAKMKFYIERLGCPKNDVDADYIAGRLLADGHEQAASAEEADAVIVNTCGFILPAKQESIGELLRHGQRRKDGSLKKLIAAGCLSQKHGGELLDGIPELDAACGLGQLDEISAALNGSAGARTAQVVDTRQLSYLAGASRHVDTGTPYAYLKISDGCDRKCSYCVIPQMRGSFRSRPIDEIVREAEFLAVRGKRELILVSQEATLYGADTGRVQIIELLQRLEAIDGIRWVRLMYLHPHALNDTLIDYLTESHKTLPYFDLPLQHINDEMLRRMRRQVRREKIERVLSDIRSKSR
ncbi:MAG TPA: MiaB/RimO family radical SAM methylthiotransferase, partial [candidate division Zixibacteria bacterium]|nr:MiaB/RimO family radical SAM methylthiotransferase [candidate division Zixibacteria bacterium]